MRPLAFPLAGMAACLLASTSALTAQATTVTTLMAKALTDIPGKEVLMITVEYAPGAADSVHRHNAHAFIYVLEGSIVMQVKGGPQVTLSPGQTFYESADDVHVVGRNASTTRPARFLVLFVKATGSPPLVPVPDGPRRHLTLAQPVVQSAISAVLGETPGDTTLESTHTIVQ